ncbi:MAG: glycosyl hydrolase, partial [Anaerolineales bacterium]|nr:glycosyl hydrolase [Anaerolineales bacterium]
ASAADIRCRATVNLQSTLQLPSILHNESTIRAWFNDPVGKTILQPMVVELMSNGGLFNNSDPSYIGMDKLNFLLDLPLRSFLHFQEDFLTQPADDIADMLLRQARSVRQ